MPLGRIEQVSSLANAVLRQDESLGDHLGLGVQVVETFGVGEGFVAARYALATHHDTVGGGVDEPLHSGRLRGVHEVLGAGDVDGEAALPVLVGDRGAAHQVDDRRGVEDGVDAVDGLRHGRGITDVALKHLEPRMGGERRRGSVKGADVVPAVQ